MWSSRASRESCLIKRCRKQTSLYALPTAPCRGGTLGADKPAQSFVGMDSEGLWGWCLSKGPHFG